MDIHDFQILEFFQAIPQHLADGFVPREEFFCFQVCNKNPIDCRIKNCLESLFRLLERFLSQPALGDVLGDFDKMCGRTIRVSKGCN